MLAAGVLSALLAGRAAADTPIEELEPAPEAQRSPAEGEAAGPAADNPWSVGVPEAERRAAEALFFEGNRLMRESITITAAAKYREALGHWDHPNIHYNLAIALMTLDQPAEIYDHLERATKYGPRPLEQERFEHARNYLALLDRQLARVNIRCAVPGAVVELDGRQLFATPGAYQGRLRAGRHTLTARGAGYVTNQSARVLEGGLASDIDLELKTIEQLTVTTRRWPAWRPWALVATGVVVGAAGGVLYAQGRDKIRTHDRHAAKQCGAPDFCKTEPSGLAKLRRDGRTMQNVGVAAIAAGGAALAGGVWLVILNKGQTRIRAYDVGEPAAPAPPPAPAPEPRVQLFPFIEPQASGLSIQARF